MLRNALQEMHTRHWGTISTYNSTATRQQRREIHVGAGVDRAGII